MGRRSRAVAVGVALVVAGCYSDLLPPADCSDYPSPLLRIRMDDSLASGGVTTSGICTSASCRRQAEAGCSEWGATMTSGDVDASCEVTLMLPQGTKDHASVKGESSGCGDLGADLFFAADGAIEITYRSPTDAPATDTEAVGGGT
jgi:hypothetical protein